MSESPVGVGTDLVDPRTISKNKDQEGRDKLALEIKESRQLGDQIKKTETKSGERQKNILVKIKNKLHIPDQQAIQLQEQILEARTKQYQLPNSKQMVEAYYEKVSETPLTNQEKRDLLKPEVLKELSTDEYIALWKRLNPYFLAHVTRQGFRDHNAMVYHSAGLQEFHNGFLNVINDEKQLRPPLALEGLKNTDEASVKMFLSKWILQAENEEEAKKRFDNQMHWSLATAPRYPDSTAVHFAAQVVANDYYGGENENEVFFAFPSDVLASQHNFTFNGWQKDFTGPQSDRKWNDVFVWPNTLENPGISVDMGIVFLPEQTLVDLNTGSKYASEVKVIDGKETRVMVEDSDLRERFNEWIKGLNDENPIMKLAQQRSQKRNYFETFSLDSQLNSLCVEELAKLGVSEESSRSILDDLTHELVNLHIWPEDERPGRLLKVFEDSNIKYKRAESAVSAKEYWERFFEKNPNLRPKHIVYYNGSPTEAIYRFQQENGIGSADTSKADGQLLGFDDHFVKDVENDPRSNMGHKELVETGKRIIEEHYRNRV